MKLFHTLIFAIYLNLLSAQVFPVTSIMNNGLDGERVIFVILGDGYTSAQLPTYITDATNITNDFFNKTPYKEYKNFFNVYAVEVPSNNSGVDHPGDASDVSEPAHPVLDVDTYFNTKFDYGGIHRLLYPVGLGTVYAVAATNVPNYNQIIVLANSPYYGGGGGGVAANSLHSSASELAIHEVGHSFANLADEYWSGATSEKANRTSESDTTLVRWADWMGSNDIGVYPYGGSAPASNYFRPHQNCEMRYLNRPFCAVCKEAIIDKIYTLVDPIDSYSPVSNTVTYSGAPLDFSLDLILPDPNTLEVEWILNGTSLATTGVSIMLTSGDLPLANNTLIANITDATLLSKSYLPASGYVFSISWTIANTTLPIAGLDFQATAKTTHTLLNWTTQTEINITKYTVERSGDGKKFEPIDQLFVPNDSYNQQSHTSIDPAPLEGKSYYRLKIIEKDGKFDYSPVRMVNRVEKFFFKIFPNPSQDRILFEYYNNSFEVNFTIDLYNSTGKLLKSIPANGFQGQHQLHIDLTAYPSGNYFLQINKADYKRQVQFIKE